MKNEKININLIIKSIIILFFVFFMTKTNTAIAAGLDVSGGASGDWGSINVGSGNGPTLNSGGIKTGLKRTNTTWNANESEDIGEVLIGWTNFALPFAAVFAILGFVLAGYFYIVDAGNGFMKDKARKILVWSIVGLTVVMLAYPATVTIIEYFRS